MNRFFFWLLSVVFHFSFPVMAQEKNFYETLDRQTSRTVSYPQQDRKRFKNYLDEELRRQDKKTKQLRIGDTENKKDDARKEKKSMALLWAAGVLLLAKL